MTTSYRILGPRPIDAAIHQPVSIDQAIAFLSDDRADLIDAANLIAFSTTTWPPQSPTTITNIDSSVFSTVPVSDSGSSWSIVGSAIKSCFTLCGMLEHLDLGSDGDYGRMLTPNNNDHNCNKDDYFSEMCHSRSEDLRGEIVLGRDDRLPSEYVFLVTDDEERESHDGVSMEGQALVHGWSSGYK